MTVDFVIGDRGFAAPLSQQTVTIAVAAEIRMQPTLVAWSLDPGVGHEESRANVVLIEQPTQVGEHSVRGPLHIDSEAYGVGIKTGRPAQLVRPHGTDVLARMAQSFRTPQPRDYPLPA
jgi:hypothetical protein